MSKRTVYIISARRSAMGRIGGLHGRRRIADLAGPVAAAALDDAGLAAGDVDELILGNMTEGGNPARIVGLACGLSETVPAVTLDGQCASGLEAIIQARRLIAAGEAEVVLAGGADSASNAPWRIARPRSVHHQPRFLGLAGDGGIENLPGSLHAPVFVEQGEELAAETGLTRAEQDDFARITRRRAGEAADLRRFSREIVPLRRNAEEYRDQAAVTLDDLEDLDELPAYREPEGLITAGTTAHIQDGSAFVLAASEEVWLRLGRPPALEIIAHERCAVPTADAARAPVAAVEALLRQPSIREAGLDVAAFSSIELNENTAVQGVFFAKSLGLDADSGVLNAAGGAIARGYPLAASGAVLAVRLFSDLLFPATKALEMADGATAHDKTVRSVDTPSRTAGEEAGERAYGLAVSGALGGLGYAIAFRACRT